MVHKYLSFPIRKYYNCNQNDIPSKLQNKDLKVIKTMLSYVSASSSLLFQVPPHQYYLVYHLIHNSCSSTSNSTFPLGTTLVSLDCYSRIAEAGLSQFTV